MTRTIIQIALPLLAPWVFWYLWRLFAKKGAPSEDDPTPWRGLTAMGLVAVIVVFVGAGLVHTPDNQAGPRMLPDGTIVRE